MLFKTIVAVLAAGAAAAPALDLDLVVRDMEQKRQLGGGGGITSNELENGDCKSVIFINARASTEPGNMVSPPSPTKPRPNPA